MALVGAIVVAARSNERKRSKLFELGITAPALISLLLAGYSGEAARSEVGGVVIAASGEMPGLTADGIERRIQQAMKELPQGEIDADSVQNALRNDLRTEVVVVASSDSSEIRAVQERLDRRGFQTVTRLPNEATEEREFLDGLLIRR